MNRVIVYFALGGLAIVIQSTILPFFLSGFHKPDLLLILIVYLGLHENHWSGAMIAFVMGLLFDSVAGVFFGLHGFAFLGIFLAVRGIVSRVNTESSALLLLLMMGGTILQALMVTFALDFFRQDLRIWPQVAWQMPPQLLMNFIAALLLLKLTVWGQKSFMPHKELPGLRKLDRKNEN